MIEIIEPRHREVMRVALDTLANERRLARAEEALERLRENLIWCSELLLIEYEETKKPELLAEREKWERIIEVLPLEILTLHNLDAVNQLASTLEIP